MTFGPIFCPDQCCGPDPGPFDCYGNSKQVSQIETNGLYRTPVHWPASVDTNAGDGTQYTSIDEGWFIEIDSDPTKDLALIARSIAAYSLTEYVHLGRYSNPQHPDAGVQSSSITVGNRVYGADAEHVSPYLVRATASPSSAVYVSQTTSGVTNSTDYRIAIELYYENWQYVLVEIRDWTGSGSSETVVIDLLNETAASGTIEALGGGRLLWRHETSTTTKGPAPAIRTYAMNSAGTTTTFNGTASVSAFGYVGMWVRAAGANSSVYESAHFNALDSSQSFIKQNFARVDRVKLLEGPYVESLGLELDSGISENEAFTLLGMNVSTLADELSADVQWDSRLCSTVIGRAGVQAVSGNDTYLAAWNCSAPTYDIGFFGVNSIVALSRVDDDNTFIVGLSSHLQRLTGGEDARTDFYVPVKGTWPDYTSYNTTYRFAFIQVASPNDFPKCFGVIPPEVEMPADPSITHPTFNDGTPWAREFTAATTTDRQKVTLTFGDYNHTDEGFFNYEAGSLHECATGVGGIKGRLDAPIIEASHTEFWSKTRHQTRAYKITYNYQDNCTGATVSSGETLFITGLTPSGTPCVWAQYLWADSGGNNPGAIFTWGQCDIQINFDSGQPVGFQYSETGINFLQYVAVKIGSNVVYEEQCWRDNEIFAAIPGANAAYLYASGLRAVHHDGAAKFVWFEKLWETGYEPTSSTPGTAADPPWRLHYCDATGADEWTLDGGTTSAIPWCCGGSGEHIYVENFELCDDRFSGSTGVHVSWVISHDGDHRYPCGQDVDGSNDLQFTAPGSGFAVPYSFVQNNSQVELSPERDQFPDSVCTP